MEATPASANGFGSAIAWEELETGLQRAKLLDRPLMLLVHASWCSACKRLRPEFDDGELAKLSQQFIMVNVDQDETPSVVQRFAPDGKYVPRVLFVDPRSGQVKPKLLNETRTRTRYFYARSAHLVTAMKKALADDDRS